MGLLAKKINPDQNYQPFQEKERAAKQTTMFFKNEIDKALTMLETTSNLVSITQVLMLILLYLILLALLALVYSVNPDLAAERRAVVTPVLRRLARPAMAVRRRLGGEGRERERERERVEQRGDRDGGDGAEAKQRRD